MILGLIDRNDVMVVAGFSLRWFHSRAKARGYNSNKLNKKKNEKY